MLKKPTASKADKSALTKKINELFKLDKITLKDIAGLSQQDCAQLAAAATKQINKLTGDDRDAFIDKIELIIPAETKSNIWEYNQQQISLAITNFMNKYGFMPAKTQVAQETGLSRQTVAKHFNDYKTHPEHVAEMEQFKYMAPRVLSNVFKYACNGDMRAAKLYFEMTGALNKQNTNTTVTEQTNYIQINNTILSQENLKQLSAEQLNQIENIIKKDEIVQLRLERK